MAKEYITAIDALSYGHGNIHKQFSKEDINREILKAYVGFSTDIPDIKSVVTGNWGCGAFRGDLRLKFLVQWLACSLAKKEMIYCPFGESKVLYDESIITKVKKQTIGEVYQNILNAAEEVRKSEHCNIYDKLL
jgi:poly(ADP-ribose) glycohydrolase